MIKLYISIISIFALSAKVFAENRDEYFQQKKESILTTYEINKETYKGVDVFTLDGGMSAEYAVQKSLSNMTSAVSHTWKIGKGGGPAPVWGEKDFLIKSAQKTVDLYNKYLGSDKPIETVIISTGVPVVPIVCSIRCCCITISLFSIC